MSLQVNASGLRPSLPKKSMGSCLGSGQSSKPVYHLPVETDCELLGQHSAVPKVCNTQEGPKCGEFGLIISSPLLVVEKGHRETNNLALAKCQQIIIDTSCVSPLCQQHVKLPVCKPSRGKKEKSGPSISKGHVRQMSADWGTRHWAPAHTRAADWQRISRPVHCSQSGCPYIVTPGASRKSFRVHQESHSHYGNWHCSVCGIFRQEEAIFAKHVSRCHPEIQPVAEFIESCYRNYNRDYSRERERRTRDRTPSAPSHTPPRETLSPSRRKIVERTPSPTVPQLPRPVPVTSRLGVVRKFDPRAHNWRCREGGLCYCQPGERPVYPGRYR